MNAGGWSRWAVLLALALAACNSSKSSSPPPAPVLQSLTVSGPVYLAVGATQQLVATGHYHDGTSAEARSGVAWASSDAAVVTVDAAGLVAAVGKGTATITVSHLATRIAAKADLTARSVVSLSVGDGEKPHAASVDTAKAYYRITGLKPGAFYTTQIDHLEDDLDLEVFSDVSLSPSAQLCVSQSVGTAPEACAAPASPAGELYVEIDGSWTEEGSAFVLGTTTATPAPLQGVAAFPAQLPLAGSVGTGEATYKVTGLTPGASYLVRISGLSADVDLEVYGDGYLFAALCGSYHSGTVNDFCTAPANAAGELFVEADGENTSHGGSFKLDVTPASR